MKSNVLLSALCPPTFRKLGRSYLETLSELMGPLDNPFADGLSLAMTSKRRKGNQASNAEFTH